MNTRTVHIPLNLPAPSDLHNHTLVPLLDLINHSSSPHLVIPRPRQVPLTRLASPGKIGFELLAPDRGLKAGEEVLFEYGRHSNALLLAEYGFVEREGIREVDLGWAVDELWQGVEGKDGKEEVLRGIGCWR